MRPPLAQYAAFYGIFQPVRVSFPQKAWSPLDRNCPLNYHEKMGFIFFLVLLAAMMLVWDFRLRFHYLFHSRKDPAFYDNFFKAVCRMTFALGRMYSGVKVILEPMKESALPKQFIAVSNHQSYADIPGIVNLFSGRNMKLVGKTELRKYLPGISIIFRKGQHAFVDRKAHMRENMNEMRRFAKLALSGYRLHIFPEGTRSRTGDLLDFQSAGIRVILDQVKLPLVSVAIDGGEKFSDLGAIPHGRIKPSYRIKALSVYPPPGTKEELLRTLDAIKAEIAATLAAWRKT
jgi:1-acyl-sn-glycerol-3-phosphate acyltransferase